MHDGFVGKRKNLETVNRASPLVFITWPDLTQNKRSRLSGRPIENVLRDSKRSHMTHGPSREYNDPGDFGFLNQFLNIDFYRWLFFENSFASRFEKNN